MTSSRTRTRPRTLDHEPAAITWARKKAGLTKRALAREIGISEQLMGEIESGWRNATPAKLLKIAQALNCPVVVLERKFPWQPERARSAANALPNGEDVAAYPPGDEGSRRSVDAGLPVRGPAHHLRRGVAAAPGSPPALVETVGGPHQRRPHSGPLPLPLPAAPTRGGPPIDRHGGTPLSSPLPPTDDVQKMIDRCSSYIHVDRRPYSERKARYQVACDRLHRGGFCDRDILMDLGAGGTELDYCLRTEHRWRGRYAPVDGWIDGTDLEKWMPRRRPDWFAALEILEHLQDPAGFLDMMKAHAERGFVLTTPNADVVDVLAMDEDHVNGFNREQLEQWGIYTTVHTFYGTPDDGLCGLWTKEQIR